MSTRVRVFGSEGGAEGVDFAHRGGEDFPFELTAHGQEGGFSEEVLGVIDLPVFHGEFFEGEGSDAEHLSGPFAITGGDDGGVDVVEAFFLKELVGRVADSVSDAGHGTDGVGAWSEVSPFPKFFERMTFLLQGVVIGIGMPGNGDSGRREFGGLSLTLAGFEFTFDDETTSDGQGEDFGLVVWEGLVGDDLEVPHAGAIVDFNEAEAPFAIASRSDPATNLDILADRFWCASFGDGQPWGGVDCGHEDPFSELLGVNPLF